MNRITGLIERVKQHIDENASEEDKVGLDGEMVFAEDDFQQLFRLVADAAKTVLEPAAVKVIVDLMIPLNGNVNQTTEESRNEFNKQPLEVRTALWYLRLKLITQKASGGPLDLDTNFPLV